MGSNGIQPDMDELRQLLDEDVDAPSAGTLPPMAFEEMFAQLSEDLEIEEPTLRGRVRSMPTRARLGLGAAAGLFFGGASLAALGLRGDFASLELPRLAAGSLIVLAVGGVAAALALRGAHKAPLGPAGRVAAVIALAIPFVSVVIPGFWEGMTVPREMAVMAILKCVALGSPIAVISGAVVLFMTRWTQTPRLRLALAGVAGGCVGFVAQQLRCPGADPMHMLLGHAGLLIVGAFALVVGAFVYGMAAARGR